MTPNEGGMPPKQKRDKASQSAPLEDALEAREIPEADDANKASDSAVEFDPKIALENQRQLEAARKQLDEELGRLVQLSEDWEGEANILAGIIQKYAASLEATNFEFTAADITELAVARKQANDELIELGHNPDQLSWAKRRFTGGEVGDLMREFYRAKDAMNKICEALYWHLEEKTQSQGTLQKLGRNTLVKRLTGIASLGGVMGGMYLNMERGVGAETDLSQYNLQPEYSSTLQANLDNDTFDLGGEKITKAEFSKLSMDQIYRPLAEKAMGKVKAAQPETLVELYHYYGGSFRAQKLVVTDKYLHSALLNDAAVETGRDPKTIKITGKILYRNFYDIPASVFGMGAVEHVYADRLRELGIYNDEIKDIFNELHETFFLITADIIDYSDYHEMPEEKQVEIRSLLEKFVNQGTKIAVLEEQLDHAIEAYKRDYDNLGRELLGFEDPDRMELEEKPVDSSLVGQKLGGDHLKDGRGEMILKVGESISERTIIRAKMEGYETLTIATPMVYEHQGILEEYAELMDTQQQTLDALQEACAGTKAENIVPQIAQQYYDHHRISVTISLDDLREDALTSVEYKGKTIQDLFNQIQESTTVAQVAETNPEVSET